jgi:hypothetical protein
MKVVFLMGFSTNRIHTMARFEEPDEEVIASECVHCGAELYEGQEVIAWEDEHFCNTDCLLESLDYNHKTLERE